MGNNNTNKLNIDVKKMFKGVFKCLVLIFAFMFVGIIGTNEKVESAYIERNDISNMTGTNRVYKTTNENSSADTYIQIKSSALVKVSRTEVKFNNEKEWLSLKNDSDKSDHWILFVFDDDADCVSSKKGYGNSDNPSSWIITVPYSLLVETLEIHIKNWNWLSGYDNTECTYTITDGVAPTFNENNIYNSSSSKWTNQHVFVEASGASDESGYVTYQYKTKSDGAWATTMITSTTTFYLEDRKETVKSYINDKGLGILYTSDIDTYVYFRVCDKAGNCSGEVSTLVRIDKTNPTYTVRVDGYAANKLCVEEISACKTATIRVGFNDNRGLTPITYNPPKGYVYAEISLSGTSYSAKAYDMTDDYLAITDPLKIENLTGEYVLSLVGRVCDLANNCLDSISLKTFYFDNIAPTAEIKVQDEHGNPAYKTKNDTYNVITDQTSDEYKNTKGNFIVNKNSKITVTYKDEGYGFKSTQYGFRICGDDKAKNCKYGDGILSKTPNNGINSISYEFTISEIGSLLSETTSYAVTLYLYIYCISDIATNQNTGTNDTGYDIYRIVYDDVRPTIELTFQEQDEHLKNDNSRDCLSMDTYCVNPNVAVKYTDRTNMTSFNFSIMYTSGISAPDFIVSDSTIKFGVNGYVKIGDGNKYTISQGNTETITLDIKNFALQALKIYISSSLKDYAGNTVCNSIDYTESNGAQWCHVSTIYIATTAPRLRISNLEQVQFNLNNDTSLYYIKNYTNTFNAQRTNYTGSYGNSAHYDIKFYSLSKDHDAIKLNVIRKASLFQGTPLEYAVNASEKIINTTGNYFFHSLTQQYELNLLQDTVALMVIKTYVSIEDLTNTKFYYIYIDTTSPSANHIYTNDYCEQEGYICLKNDDQIDGQITNKTLYDYITNDIEFNNNYDYLSQYSSSKSFFAGGIPVDGDNGLINDLKSTIIYKTKLSYDYGNALSLSSINDRETILKFNIQDSEKVYAAANKELISEKVKFNIKITNGIGQNTSIVLYFYYVNTLILETDMYYGVDDTKYIDADIDIDDSLAYYYFNSTDMDLVSNVANMYFNVISDNDAFNVNKIKITNFNVAQDKVERDENTNQTGCYLSNKTGVALVDGSINLIYSCPEIENDIDQELILEFEDIFGNEGTKVIHLVTMKNKLSNIASMVNAIDMLKDNLCAEFSNIDENNNILLRIDTACAAEDSLSIDADNNAIIVKYLIASNTFNTVKLSFTYNDNLNLIFDSENLQIQSYNFGASDNPISIDNHLTKYTDDDNLNIIVQLVVFDINNVVFNNNEIIKHYVGDGAETVTISMDDFIDNNKNSSNSSYYPTNLLRFYEKPVSCVVLNCDDYIDVEASVNNDGTILLNITAKDEVTVKGNYEFSFNFTFGTCYGH